MSEPERRSIEDSTATTTLALAALRERLAEVASRAGASAISAQAAGQDAPAHTWNDRAADIRAMLAATDDAGAALWSAAVQMREALEALDNGYIRCAACRAWGHFGEPVDHEPDCVALAWDAAVRGLADGAGKQPDGE